MKGALYLKRVSTQNFKSQMDRDFFCPIDKISTEYVKKTMPTFLKRGSRT